MANVDPFIPKIFPWETGKTIDKAELVKMVKLNADPGGWTKFGITLDTWQTTGYDKDGDGDIDKDDLALITVSDYEQTIKKTFWDRWKADLIKIQSIAEMLVDWVWASGKYGITEPQTLLGLKADGIVGPMTINAINFYPGGQAELHKRLYDQRFAYIDRIVSNSVRKYKEANPNATQQEVYSNTFLCFEKGWKNRIISLFEKFAE